MKQSSYNKNNPFFASIKERYSLCKSGAHKETHHIVLDISGSDLHHDVGDSIAIFPRNDPTIVQQLLKAARFTGEEKILDRSGKELSLIDFLLNHANVSEISRKFLNEVMLRQSNEKKKVLLEELQFESNKEILKTFLSEHCLSDLLLTHSEAYFSPQEFASFLMPLLPRFYSIASSMKARQGEIHMTVALLKYTCNGIIRTGVCTQYLCELAPLYQPVIPLYIQPHHGFTLPADHLPIIMIGPGTGVAPFRAFMQERLMRGATGKNWLFFGECYRQTTFFYEEFWNQLVVSEKLRLDLAFSRDQPDKVYVQHKMEEQGADLFQWLEEGAVLFVCGDAQRMAKDVEATLLKTIALHGKYTEEEAKTYLKKLRQEKRYLRDIY